MTRACWNALGPSDVTVNQIRTEPMMPCSSAHAGYWGMTLCIIPRLPNGPAISNPFLPPVALAVPAPAVPNCLSKSAAALRGCLLLRSDTATAAAASHTKAMSAAKAAARPGPVLKNRSVGRSRRRIAGAAGSRNLDGRWAAATYRAHVADWSAHAPRLNADMFARVLQAGWARCTERRLGGNHSPTATGITAVLLVPEIC